MTDESRYTLEELEKLVDISARTIRYYTGIGLLPPPEERGRYAYYSAGHLQRLRLIKQLKEADLGLGAIRRYVENVPAEPGVDALPAVVLAATAAAAPPAPPTSPPTDSAADYIARVLAAQGETQTLPNAPAPAPAQAAASPARTGSPPASETWERHTLAPGVELAIRRDAAKARRAELDELLDYAQHLFSRRSK